jgi:hypothetical protein
MHHLSFGREEEGSLGTRIPYYERMFEDLTNLFSIAWWVRRPAADRDTGGAVADNGDLSDVSARGRRVPCGHLPRGPLPCPRAPPQADPVAELALQDRARRPPGDPGYGYSDGITAAVRRYPWQKSRTRNSPVV